MPSRHNCIDIYVATHAEGEVQGRLLHRGISDPVKIQKASPAETAEADILPEGFFV